MRKLLLSFCFVFSLACQKQARVSEPKPTERFHHKPPAISPEITNQPVIRSNDVSYITFKSLEPQEIYLDGFFVGKTPTKKIPVYAGTYRVFIKKFSTNSHLPDANIIQVVPGEERSIQIKSNCVGVTDSSRPSKSGSNTKDFRSWPNLKQIGYCNVENFSVETLVNASHYVEVSNFFGQTLRDQVLNYMELKNLKNWNEIAPFFSIENTLFSIPGVVPQDMWVRPKGFFHKETVDTKNEPTLYLSKHVKSYFRYNVVESGSGSNARFTIFADGDLNGDGKASIFYQHVGFPKDGNFAEVSPICALNPEE